MLITKLPCVVSSSVAAECEQDFRVFSICVSPVGLERGATDSTRLQALSEGEGYYAACPEPKPTHSV